MPTTRRAGNDTLDLLAARVRRLRESKGWSRAELASRSGLSVQVIAAEQLVLDIWDKYSVASRATLRAQLRAALGKIPQIVGQVGTDLVAGHAPAPTP